MKIVYVDTTNNQNNELGFTNEINFKIPSSGTSIQVRDKNYELRNAAVDNLNNSTYLFLIRRE